jgi:hypothetical protein
MALVLKTDNKDFSPVYNPMNVVIFQNNAVTLAKPDYKYIFDINIIDYISGLPTVIRTKVSPDPFYKYGIQDLHSIIENYVKETIPPYDDTDAIRVTDNAIIKFYVEYGEEYRLTVNDPIVQYLDQYTGNIQYAWGSSLEHHRFIDFFNNDEFENYLCLTTSIGEFLTNQKNNKVYANQLGWHWYMTSAPNNVDYLQVKTYDASGVLISTFDIPNNSNPSLDRSRLNSVATSPQSLNNITGAFLVGAQPVIIPTVANYTVQLFRTGAVPVSEILYFEIDTECFYETYRIHFENEYGAFDSFNFKADSKKSTSAERKTYITNRNILTLNGLVYNHVTDTKVNYYVKSTDSITLQSGLIDQATNEWLKELSFSPQAYLEFVDSSGVHNFKPCLVKSTSWNELKDEVDKTFNFSIDIELSDNFRQRR